MKFSVPRLIHALSMIFGLLLVAYYAGFHRAFDLRYPGVGNHDYVSDLTFGAFLFAQLVAIVCGWDAWAWLTGRSSAALRER